MKSNGTCKNILGDALILNNTIKNSFVAKIFEPYSTFMFFLDGSANSK
jgi:hypothetical protein